MTGVVETFLNSADFALMNETARVLWNTQRLGLSNPTATILRYTEYPNPITLTSTVISNSGLFISEDIVGRSINLVEGVLDKTYTVTGYTSTSITVSSADFIADGFTIACTFHIEAIKYQKKMSPTLVQVLIVGTESLIDRDVAYYNLSEKEILQFNNELNISDKRFVFFDISISNDDIIILDGQKYQVYKVKYNPVYAMQVVYGKSMRKM